MILKEHPKKPKQGCIIVKELEKEKFTQTASGIYIPESEDENSVSGLSPAEVIAVGDDFLNYKMVSKKGDKVLIKSSIFEKANNFYIVDAQKYHIVSENDYYYGTIESADE